MEQSFHNTENKIKYRTIPSYIIYRRNWTISTVDKYNHTTSCTCHCCAHKTETMLLRFSPPNDKCGKTTRSRTIIKYACFLCYIRMILIETFRWQLLVFVLNYHRNHTVTYFSTFKRIPLRHLQPSRIRSDI